jgi:hypothetical protein
LSREVVQGLVIGHDGELGTVEVGSPRLEGTDDREELLFVSRISSFGGLHFLGEIGDWLQSFALVLHEHSSDGESRGVGVNDEGELGVREDEHRVTLQGVLERLEGGGLSVPPRERNIVVSELREW